MSQLLLKISNFVRGMVTSYGRGEEPDGSFSDSRNLIPTKKGSLEQAHGYSTTGGLAALPTGYEDVAAGATTYDISTMEFAPFAYSLEKPAAHDGRVYFMQDDVGTNHVMLSNIYVLGDSATQQYGVAGSNYAARNEIVPIDERKIIDANHADVSRVSPVGIGVNNAATTHGLVLINDYYNGWQIIYTDSSSGEVEYGYIEDYIVSGANVTINLKETINDASGLGWDDGVPWAAGDTLTLRRWFHSKPTMVADFDTLPGRCFESEGRVRGSGGASSDEDKFPWFMEYISRTWFTGHAEAQTYTGTYVDVMEMTWDIRGDAGQVLVAPTLATVGGGVTAFTAGRTYYLGFTIEYDGYQEGRLSYFLTTAAVAAEDTIDFDLIIPFSKLNKRVTGINIYMKEVAGGIESSASHVKHISFITDEHGSAFSTWSWVTNTQRFGYFTIVGSARTNEAHVKATDWFNRGQTYTQRTGRLEELTTATPPSYDTTRHIISWKEVEVIAGRALFGNYYDPNTAETYYDQIRFTHIASTGVPSYDAIPSERDLFEKDVATGDPGTVRRLIEQNGYLVIFKDDSIFTFYITPTPETWSPQTITTRDGLVSVESVVKMPNGDIGFADVDFYKIIRNGDIVPITWNIEATYYNLTKTSIVAWYDKIDSSLRFTDQQVSSSEYPIYCTYPHLSYAEEGRLIMPWYKLRIPHRVEFVATERDEGALFTNGTATVVYEWHKTDKTYAGTSIKPYLKTHPQVRDDEKHMAIDRVELVRLNTTGAAGSLVSKLYIDSSSVTTTFASVDPTATDVTNIQQKVRPTEKRMGRTIQYEYNTDGTPETNGTNNIQVHSINYYGKVVIPRKINRGSIVIP